MLIPETTRSGTGWLSACTPSCTQSAGYPEQVNISMPPTVVVVTVTGSKRVIALLTHDRSRSGTTTVTVPISERAAANDGSPGASTPSSLVSRMDGIGCTVPGTGPAPATVESRTRPIPGD